MDMNEKHPHKLSFEEDAWRLGYRFVAGVDEAGRGPLAGPVCCAACILDPEKPIDGLDDSKKITARMRDRLFDEILQKALAYEVRLVSASEIEELNILEATRRGMREAVLGLVPEADYVLLDAVTLADFPLPQLSLVQGDARSDSIAAASILAKVTRDRYMKDLDMAYPGYGFAKHKGYGTKLHYDALDHLGPCPEHRSLFLRSWRLKRDRER